MPRRLPDTKRDAILADIRAGAKSRNRIARDHGVSAGIVSKIAKDERVHNAFDRSQTKKAAAAAAADHKLQLAGIATRSAGVAGNVLASFEVMTGDDWQRVSPHTRAVALGILADKARELAPEDSGADEAKSLLGRLFTGLSASVREDAAG